MLLQTLLLFRRRHVSRNFTITHPQHLTIPPPPHPPTAETTHPHTPARDTIRAFSRTLSLFDAARARARALSIAATYLGRNVCLQKACADDNGAVMMMVGEMHVGQFESAAAGGPKARAHATQGQRPPCRVGCKSHAAPPGAAVAHACACAILGRVCTALLRVLMCTSSTGVVRGCQAGG